VPACAKRFPITRSWARRTAWTGPTARRPGSSTRSTARRTSSGATRSSPRWWPCGSTPRTSLGVVSAPALGTRWDGLVGHGAHQDGRPIRVSDVTDLADAEIAFGGLNYFEREGWIGVVERASRVTRRAAWLRGLLAALPGGRRSRGDRHGGRGVHLGPGGRARHRGGRWRADSRTWREPPPRTGAVRCPPTATCTTPPWRSCRSDGDSAGTHGHGVRFRPQVPNACHGWSQVAVTVAP
jgi:hypothetical protein